MAPPEDPRRHTARTSALTSLVGAGGGRRAFVDATGTPVPLRGRIEHVVATDDAGTGATLLGIGVRPVGMGATCGAGFDAVLGAAFDLDGIAHLGPASRLDLAAIAELRPHVIVTSAEQGAHNPAIAPQVAALRRIAPVVAIDLTRPGAAAADLRALLGAVAVERRAADPLPPPPPPGPPVTRPRLW